jgi:hypothetical protein
MHLHQVQMMQSCSIVSGLLWAAIVKSVCTWQWIILLHVLFSAVLEWAARSLRIVWIHMKIKEGFMTGGKVSTKQNVSDLGTKRPPRDRMEYFMYLLKKLCHG